MWDWKYRPKDISLSSEERRQQDELKEVKPEGFASRNVKTITFLICLAVFLLLFGPVSVFHLVRMAETEELEGKEMTEAELIRLADLGPALSMSILMEYEGEASESENRRFYYINFDNYLLLAVEDIETKQLDFCTLKDRNSEDQIEILTGDVAAFLESH